MNLFHEEQIYKTRCQAINTFHSYDFLSRSVEQELAERALSLIQHPSSVLLHSTRTSILVEALQHHTITYDQPLHDSSSMQPYEQDQLNTYTDHSFDLIVDVLTLHTINDVPQILRNYRRLLRPQGKFLAAFYGGETLREFRDSLVAAELTMTGGAALRVIPMIDLQSALKLLQHGEFSYPIVDREINTINYDSTMSLLRDIRGMGEHQPFMDVPPNLPHQLFKTAAHYYQKHFYNSITAKLYCTVEVIYLKGDAP